MSNTFVEENASNAELFTGFTVLGMEVVTRFTINVKVHVQIGIFMGLMIALLAAFWFGMRIYSFVVDHERINFLHTFCSAYTVFSGIMGVIKATTKVRWYPENTGVISAAVIICLICFERGIICWQAQRNPTLPISLWIGESEQECLMLVIDFGPSMHVDLPGVEKCCSLLAEKKV